MTGLMAKKIGMTQVFDEAGNMIPVTVIHVEPNVVVSTKSKETSGYDAVVMGLGALKPSKVTKPYAGQFVEGIAPVRHLREFRDFDREIKVGDKVGVELFESARFVDVTAISKGKGFQGVMKRWGFHGGPSAHGSKFHRAPGSTGQNTSPSRTMKNTKMSGRMGRNRVTVQNLRVHKIDPEHNILLVRGAVPGKKSCELIVKMAVKKGF